MTHYYIRISFMVPFRVLKLIFKLSTMSEYIHVEMQVDNRLEGERFHGVQDFVTKRPTMAFM